MIYKKRYRTLRDILNILLLTSVFLLAVLLLAMTFNVYCNGPEVRTMSNFFLLLQMTGSFGVKSIIER